MRGTPKRTPTPEASAAARFLGYVQVHVGSQVFTVPVQSVAFTRDGEDQARGASAGGFFAEPSGQLGILVDGNASPSDVQGQIDRAIADAARHLSRRFLN